MTVAERLRERIRREGPLTFAEFMRKEESERE